MQHSIESCHVILMQHTSRTDHVREVFFSCVLPRETVIDESAVTLRDERHADSRSAHTAVLS